jgi:UDP-N-acetyl-D-glucosamine/UDP-N-acetyl-D-galactosamine dehydrogenase
MKLHKNKIGIIGMGYVGLPLAAAFAKKQKVIGFDINKKRIKDLINGLDITNEINRKNLKNLKNLKFSDDINELKSCEIYIVTVPTPVNTKNKPDLKPLLNATKIISKVLTKNNLVIYESTVFPGATEELCGPILEKNSGFRVNHNLFLGYSPERINPGDEKRKLSNIVKIVSGSNIKAQKKISNLYSSIIKAGIYKAESIKIAEAAKVIENTQRDLNIAFINELSIIFKKLNLSTEKILKAAETKWNFIPFRPGLVGGHCIGVDPYYLTYKAKKVGYKPKIILSGRNLNDQMSLSVFEDINNILIKKNKKYKNKKKILIMGLTFKENCPDTRNSKVLDLFNHFKKEKFEISSYDPYSKSWSSKFKSKYNIIESLKNRKFDAIILAVKHQNFIRNKKKIKDLCNKSGFIYDLKYLFPESPNIYRL